MVIMNKLSTDRRAAVIGALVEGNSIRATCRMTGTAKGTVARLLATVGDACARYQNDVLKELVCRRLQVDEIWSFCYAKEKNVPDNRRGQFGYGDVWTWTALDSDSKLVPVWLVGGRDAGDAYEFLSDLRTRLTNRVQLTTDGHRAYLSAVEEAFGADIDYSQLIKIYGNPLEADTRYSPGAMHRMQARARYRQTRSAPCFDKLCRKTKSHDANVHAPVHSADECLLKEDREPPSHAVAVLRPLQFLPPAQEPAWQHPGDGRWRF